MDVNLSELRTTIKFLKYINSFAQDKFTGATITATIELLEKIDKESKGDKHD